jgi:hypothetical protein
VLAAPVASPVTSGAGTDPWVVIVLALISAVVSVVGGFFAYRAATHAKQANDSVNHRHLHGVDEHGEPTTPRLFDLAVETHATVTSLTDRVSRLDQSNTAQFSALARIVARHTARLDRAEHIVGRLDTLTHRLLQLEERVPHRADPGPMFAEPEDGVPA